MRAQPHKVGDGSHRDLVEELIGEESENGVLTIRLN